MSKKSVREAVLLVGIGAFTAAVLVLSYTNTWVEQMKMEESRGLLQPLETANYYAGPIALVSFAVGVGWLFSRRWLRAALAIPAFPAWCGVLLFFETWIVNKTWFLVVLAPMQGIQPFGPPPS